MTLSRSVEWKDDDDERRIVNDLEGSGRDLIWGITPEFAWRDWGKPQKPSVRISSLRT
jgi:hypothetical protein